MTNNNQTNTNALPTLTNISQRSTNWLFTTRRGWMILLSALAAITLVGQYVLLGVAGLGESRDQLPTWFVGLELTLWGCRALVEIAVVVYISMTKTTSPGQERILSFYKTILIGLIIYTIGPIFADGILNIGLLEILGYWGVILWGGGLAGITAMMLAGVATAYKYQPIEEDSVVVTLVEYNEMLATVGSAEWELRKMLAELDEVSQERDQALIKADAYREACSILALLGPSASVRVVALFAEGMPSVETISQAFELRPATVRGVLAKVDNPRDRQ